MAQHAQLKSMVTGDFDGAVKLLRSSLSLARSREEALELAQVRNSPINEFNPHTSYPM